MNLRIPCTVTNKQYIFKDNCEESTTGIDNQYDDKGRITATGYNGYNIYYQYDSDGQLVRVDDNYACSDTSVYTYDSRGNVTEKKVYPFTRDETITSSPTETTTFTYANTGWKDLLVSVNGVELTYDANGNVLTYGDREYTWNTGRNLASITDGSNTYSYKYDENGIRTSKTVNGVTTHYNAKDGVILSQSDGTNTMYFQYDTSGTPFGFVYNGTQYFYMTNQMGDVICITEANGNIFCEYVYDEWGKVIAINYVDENNAQQIAVATANPLRYRGYYYDIETGYYYLQSRYYDPSICRFINADNPDVARYFRNKINGTNIFAYCLNEPINYFDLNGHTTVSLKGNTTSNIIVKFARKLDPSWEVSSSVKSKKYILRSVCGVTLYIGASASTSLTAMKNNISSGNGYVKVSNECSLNYRKAKLSYSTATTYKDCTLKAVVTLGTISIAYGLSLITKYFYTSRSSCYFSIDIGFRISHLTTAAATVIVGSLCVAAPYIAPAVGKIYTNVLASIISYKTFIRNLTTIAGCAMTMGKCFA